MCFKNSQLVMKLETGKYYKTRDGSKAIVYKLWANFPMPIRGAVLYKEDWANMRWDGLGSRSATELSDWDLVSEWKETITVKAWWGSDMLFWSNAIDPSPSNTVSTIVRVPSEDKTIEVEEA